MAKRRQQCDYPNCGRSALGHKSETEMHVDAPEDQVVADPVHHSAARALAIDQPRELAIRIVHRIRDHVEKHPQNIGREISIEIKMSRGDAGHRSQESDCVRSKSHPGEQARQGKADLAVEMKVEKSLDL